MLMSPAPAHICRCFPCQSFTPRLADVYNALKKKRDGEVEVVFVSHDNHSGQFELYFQHQADLGGAWLAVPFKECRAEREELARACRVLGIPTLTVIGPDGTVVAPNARNAVSKDSAEANFPWEGATASANHAPIWIVIIMFLLFIFLPKIFPFLRG